MRLVLVVPKAGMVARELRIVLDEHDVVDVGGVSDCRAVVDDPSVGTARFRLERVGAHWTICDLEGLGKCVVGGVRLRARARRIVGPHTRLRLGTVECRLELEPTTMPGDHATRDLAFRLAESVGAVAPDEPVVRIAEGERPGEAVTLARGQPRLAGRGRRCDLFIDDPDVSREHLSIEWRGDRVLVTDLGSRAGTYLGSSRLDAKRAAVWHPGRMVSLGKTILLLEPTASEILGGIVEHGEGAEREAPAPAGPVETPAEATSEPDAAAAETASASETSPGPTPREIVSADTSRRPERGAGPMEAVAAGTPRRAVRRSGSARLATLVVAGVVLLALSALLLLGWVLVS